MFYQKPLLGQLINWSNPITHNLRFYTLLNEYSGGMSNDIVGGLKGIHTDITYVPGGLNNATATGIVNFGDNLDSLKQLTINVFVNYIATAGSYDYILNKHFDQYNMYINRETGEHIAYSLKTNLVTLDSKTWDGGLHTMPTGKTMLTYTWDNINLKLYINGVYVDSVAAAGSATVANANDLCLFNRSSDSGRAWYGDIYTAGIWERALSLGEVNKLYIDPFQIFRRKMILDVIAAVVGNPWYYYAQQ